ncbi:MAG: rhodanese-like domain-containing protein [Rhodospirillaceae bacterium]
MKLKKNVKQLIAEAEQEIETISPDDAVKLLEDETVQFIDIRDVRELEREGMIPGAFHAPRGMLEFWVDPESPYHKDVFASGKKFVFYCQSNWRAVLATKALQDMGLEPVASLRGGFAGWRNAGHPTADRPKKD